MANRRCSNERFFAVAVAYRFYDAPTAMYAWLVLKLAANWLRCDVGSPSPNRIRRGFVALVAGLISKPSRGRQV